MNPFGEEEANPFQLEDEQHHEGSWGNSEPSYRPPQQFTPEPHRAPPPRPAPQAPASGGLRAASSAAREAELERREAELKSREAKLIQREKEVGTYHPPNFPPFKPLVYHDIKNDIPEGGQWLVQRLFTAWWLSTATYLVNFCAAFGLLIVKAESAGGTFGLALVILLVGTPVSFVFWYQPIYNGVKRDRSVSFFLFFFNYSCHLAFSALLAIGIPGWGGAGVIYTLSNLGSNVAVGILCAIASSMLIFECVFGLWQIKAVHGYFRSKGLTAEQAKQQAIQGVASSGIGRELAGAAIKSSMV